MDRLAYTRQFRGHAVGPVDHQRDLQLLVALAGQIEEAALQQTHRLAFRCAAGEKIVVSAAPAGDTSPGAGSSAASGTVDVESDWAISSAPQKNAAK